MTVALLVIDMQHALCSGEEAAFGIEGVIEKVNALSARARAAGSPVILIQHEEDEGPLQFGSEGWALAGGLFTDDEDTKVRKRTPNSFHQTDLHPLLQDRGASRVVICGLQTEFCVDTTVRQALPLGYSGTLAADAHSTTDGALRAEQVIAHHNCTLDDELWPADGSQASRRGGVRAVKKLPPPRYDEDKMGETVLALLGALEFESGLVWKRQTLAAEMIQACSIYAM